VVALGALETAQGMLFVTDASQELTAPELSFLKQALERCHIAACVVTKTDLHPEWRRIVDLDREHLRSAGIEMPVLPVSSFLRLRAGRSSEVTEESGFPALVDFLAESVMRRARQVAAESAAQEAGFAAAQIAREIRAEQAVLIEPANVDQVLEELTAQRRATAALVAPTATWQQALADGVQDLVADIEHDLAQRLRGVLREAETVIDKGDPKDSFEELQIWLQRQVARAAVANYDLMTQQAQELAAAVAESFQMLTEEPVTVATIVARQSVPMPSRTSQDRLAAPAGRFGSMLMATRMAMFVPMALFGVAGSILGVAIAAPVTAALAAGIGQKIIRDEKKRQLAYRRQQAKGAARSYLDEVGFVMNKQTRDALRRTQRQLRDEFGRRAAMMHQSSVRAVDAAHRAIRLSVPEQQSRSAELSAQASRLRTVDRELRGFADRTVAVGKARG
jgi:hypothetical protein